MWSPQVTRELCGALRKLLFHRLSADASILDVCCGSGRIAQSLTHEGYQVTGVDESSAMIEIARRRVPRAKFICAKAEDFRVEDFRLNENEFDAAVSVFDSLNHILTLPRLKQAFRNVHRALKTGGVFVFDMNLETAFHHRWLEHSNLVTPESVVAIEGIYDSHTHLGRYDFTIFYLQKSIWERADFTIRERCYTLAQIRRTLKASGFINVEEYDAENDLNLRGHTGRMFFVARAK